MISYTALSLYQRLLLIFLGQTTYLVGMILVPLAWAGAIASSTLERVS